MLDWLRSLFSEPTYRTFGRPRSGQWRRVRREHLERNPACAVCGGTTSVEVHHKIPFHVSPHLELDPHNLITLCEDGPGGMNCHFVVGHCGRGWDHWNPGVVHDAEYLRVVLSRKVSC